LVKVPTTEFVVTDAVAVVGKVEGEVVIAQSTVDMVVFTKPDAPKFTPVRIEADVKVNESETAPPELI
jgi:replication-associated recombination protein RarA